ncbi:MAG: MFS transporter, partial [Anaerovoracaceae bacterium]
LTVSTLGATLLIDVATAAAGIGLLSAVMIPRQPAADRGASVFEDMKEGIRYTVSDKLIGKVLTVYGLFIFLCVPAGFLSQLFVSRVYGETYWYLTAVELTGFLGMVAGGLLMSVWGGFKSRAATMSFGLAAFGLLAVGMGLSRQFVLYLALMLLYGVAITMVQTATTTLIQEKAEMSVQGRVFGLLGAMYSGFLPVGMAVFGPLADVIPLRWIMVGSGIGLMVLSLFISMDRKIQ